MQKINVLKFVFLQKGFHFPHGIPPQIVVSLENDFPARQRVEVGKICLGLLKINAPREISANDNRILLVHDCLPARAQLFHIILPASAKDIHWLVNGTRQMQVCNGIKCHRAL